MTPNINNNAHNNATTPLPLPELLAQRQSTRGFLPDAVAPALLTTLLTQARRAPSGGNLQPGHFIQVTGAARDALTAALLDDWRLGRAEHEDYRYFPQPMPHALRKRQVLSAQALYGALGVARHDQAGRHAQFARNYRFFDAPVALVVTIDAAFGPGGYMDLGMTLYGLQLAAAHADLGSCAIGALASYPDTVRAVLGLPDTDHIVCGLALGWPDPHAPINTTHTTRAPLQDYFRSIDWEGPAGCTPAS